jgi:predicted HD phosphohydrolase
VGLTEETVDEIVGACRSMVGLPYDGEPVDQLEHALQCAALARQERGDDAEFVIACLLHDIARAPAVAGIPYDGPQEHHGEAGARWLTPRVGARVAWLAEQRTLIAQGGAMSEAEVAQFRANPDWPQAVQLRRFDDLAKVAGLEVPDIDSYRPELATVVATTLQR